MTAFEIEDREFYNLLPNIKVDGFLQKPFSMYKLNDVIAYIYIVVVRGFHSSFPLESCDKLIKKITYNSFSDYTYQSL